MRRVLSEAQKIAARDATRRYRAKKKGCQVDFVRPKRVSNSGSFSSEMLTRHGMHATATWRAWKDMKSRCNNPNRKNYSYYGGRGIRVCERWDIFENFLADMGIRPEGKSLERSDNEGGYAPGNCIWATRQQQANNTRRNRSAEINGEAHTISEWARMRGVSRFLIRDRLNAGLPPSVAILGVGTNV